MENLLAQRKWDALVDQFDDEEIRQWPFWQIGAAAFARGRAYYGAQMGEKADADLKLALEFTSDGRTRISILRTMGFNRERVLKDDTAALKTYRRIAASKTHTGSAEYYSGIQGAARILTDRGQFDAALEMLNQVDTDKLRGYWRASMLLARGRALVAADRHGAARSAFQKVASDETANPSHRRTASEALEKLPE